MFCHLFKMGERTGVQLNEFEQCDPKCSLSKEKNCLISDQRMESLTKDKYSWVLETVVYFDPPRVSKSGITKYMGAICLIHPAHNDIWIIRNIRHNKVEDVWEPEFRMYFGTDMKDFTSIASINTYLKKNGYTGRKLVIEDFEKIKPKEE